MLGVEALEALRVLLAEEGSRLEVLNLANCQLCGPLDSGAEHKPGGSMVGGGRYETRGVALIAAAVRERRCPLKELVLSGNAIRDAEASNVMAAVGDHLQAMARNDRETRGVAITPLVIDFDGKEQLRS